MRQRIAPVALSWFSAQPNAVFKFVVSDPEDFQELQHLRDELAIPASRVVVMPQAEEVSELVTRGGWLRSTCDALGYELSPRLQISLWAGRRGR